MNRRFVIAAAIASASLAWASPSLAQDAKGFGDKGQLIVTADRLFPVFSYSSVSTTQTNNNTTTTETTKGSSFVLLVGAEPEVASIHTVPRVAVDYTIIPRLTLGGSVVVAFGLGGGDHTEIVQGATTTTREVDAPSRTILGIGPRVGYIIPFGDVLAFWPRGGLSFYSVRQRTDVVINNGNATRTDTDSDSIFSLDLDPQLAIVPIQHFFFHVGPLVNIPLAGSRKHEETQGGTTTTVSNDLSIFHIGISAGLGGWFDLDRPPLELTPDSSTAAASVPLAFGVVRRVLRACPGEPGDPRKEAP